MNLKKEVAKLLSGLILPRLCLLRAHVLKCIRGRQHQVINDEVTSRLSVAILKKAKNLTEVFDQINFDSHNFFRKNCSALFVAGEISMTYNWCPIVHSWINSKDLSIVNVFGIHTDLNHSSPLTIRNIVLLHCQVILYSILIQ